ncbi:MULTISPECIES: acetylornithine deacetylase [unclassified Brevibacterium]|uniref:acetylornithine deacetylase n=1 Tax=unclassified Brevibacterium TaxID=2614124 RepID=UPI001E33D308|nr:MULTISPECIES: acetylornithine deacetylase [unclassified Brevibacterium]MCD1286395.1 acetylornithine deacetylase [Brevibacterium sp. CCUG 69071]MDK8433763.1 acetylornithine deacetylase [Brevibacterium sp. H-BE7]
MSAQPAEATIREITELIGFDTTSRDTNLPLIDHVEARLEAAGLSSQRIPNAEGTKANLLATIPAADGSTSGGIVLSGHTDVVPIDGQDWSSQPFTPDTRDGKLYARGSADMKSFIGVILAKLPELTSAKLAEPIHLAFSYDEEIGCVGAIDLVDTITEKGLAPRGCIVGEPSSMRVIRGHKSMNVFRVDFHGVAAHSSLTPEGVNAIAYAAEFVAFVHAVAAEFRTDGPFDDAYVVPFTTVTANTITGGIAINTIPAEASVEFEFRSLGAVDQQALIARFRAEAERLGRQMAAENEAAGVDFTVTAAAPGCETPADAEIVSLAASWGGIATDDKVTYGTEAGLFSNAGIPTVVCGPGDIAQAHAPDEFIELSQIAACESFIDSLVTDLSRS